MLQRRIDLQYMHPTFKQTTILKKPNIRQVALQFVTINEYQNKSDLGETEGNRNAEK